MNISENELHLRFDKRVILYKNAEIPIYFLSFLIVYEIAKKKNPEKLHP